MIRFSLHCDKDHEFEGWFSSSKDYDDQAERGLVECPVCGSRQVGKALMAPAVAVSKEAPARPLAMDPEKREMMRKLRELVQAVKQNSEDVGERFAEEARRIHYGESENRGIRGRVSADEREALRDEGIETFALPIPAALKDPLQ